MENIFHQNLRGWDEFSTGKPSEERLNFPGIGYSNWDILCRSSGYKEHRNPGKEEVSGEETI